MDRNTVGVDLGGTKVKAALVRHDGTILYSVRKLTNAAAGSDSVIATVAEAVQECLQRGTSTAVGLGVAGQIDLHSGDVIFAPNLGWLGVPLRAELQRQVGLPVLIVNDVRAATFGEWTYGVVPQEAHMLCLWVGTGIGGGVVTDGQMLDGCNNSAAEFGHMTIVADGRRCRCPNFGCLEAYVGGWAIAERTQELIRHDVDRGRRILEIAGSLEGISAESVSAAYTERDALARQIVEQTARYLAAGVVAIVNAFNPCVLVLGGGVIEGIPALLDVAEPIIRKRALPSATANLKILRSSLATNAGCIGAAVLARTVATEDAQ